MTVSIQSACAFVLVITIVALYQHDERWGLDRAVRVLAARPRACAACSA